MPLYSRFVLPTALSTSSVRFMRSYFALIVCVLIAGMAYSDEMAAPASIHRQIEEKSARDVVKSLYGTPNWDRMIEGIASGEKSWLRVAVELAPGTDAGSSSELQDAVAWALPYAPERVIAIAEKVERFRNVCSGPPVDFPSDDAKAYFAAAIDSVQKIVNPALAAAKRRCLAKLRHASGM